MGQRKTSNSIRSSGFTIVELLIVVVVIAILAAITIVAYNGIQNRSKASAAQSNLSGAAKALELSKVNSATSQYPSSLPSTVSLNNATYEYSSDTNQYCLTHNVGGIEYFIVGLVQKPVPGSCTGMTAWWPLNGTISELRNGLLTTTVGSSSGGVGQNGTQNSGWESVGDGTTRYLATSYVFDTASFSASIWAKPDGGGPSSFASILSNTRDCCATYTGFQIDYNRGSQNLDARLWDNASAVAVSIKAPGVMTVGNWRHIVLTYDSAVLRLYIDGALSGSIAYVHSATPGTATYPLKIGGMGASSSGYSFGGTLDDARIYNRPLTASEVSSMYSLGAQ